MKLDIRKLIDKEKIAVDELLYTFLDDKNGNFEIASEQSEDGTYSCYMYATYINGHKRWGLLSYSYLYEAPCYMVEWSEMTQRNIKEGFEGMEAEEWILLRNQEEFVLYLCGDIRFGIEQKKKLHS